MATSSELASALECIRNEKNYCHSNDESNVRASCDIRTDCELIFVCF